MFGTKKADLGAPAMAFFDACETGKGWSVCQAWCEEGATFDCQSGALAEMKSLAAYCDWMQANGGPLPDAHYEMTAFGVDQERNCVIASAVFKATHTGEGGPVPPTGKSASSDYAYIIQFKDGKISHMTKIWNDAFAFGQLGWA